MTIDGLLGSLTNEVFANVNIGIVVALMALGFVIKHFKFLEKFSNEFIPPVLLLVSFVFTFIDNGISTVSAITAIVTAAVAIGLHQSGKNIFMVSIVPNIVNLLSGAATEDDITETEE